MSLLLLEQRRFAGLLFSSRGCARWDPQTPEHTTESDLKGVATYWTMRWVIASPRTRHATTPPQWMVRISRVHVAFYWNEMDAWYEEEERAFAHARDPTN
jgi:hypothetical protein